MKTDRKTVSSCETLIVTLALSLTAAALLGQEPGPQGAFQQGAFTNLKRLDNPVNSEHWESMGSLSSDRLTLFFVSNRPPSVGSEFCVDLWVARRSSPDAPFGEPTNEGVLRNVNSAGDECTPRLSADDRVLTFYSDRHAPSSGDYELYVATRDEPSGEFRPAIGFSAAFPDSGISSPYAEFGQSMSCDSLAIYFSSDRPGGRGGFDLHVATRDSPGGIFGNVRNLSALNTEAHEFSPIVSPDNLTLFFSDLMPPFREGGLGEGDIWMVTRSSTEEDWRSEDVRNLGWPINSQFADLDFFVSHDWPAEGSTIWFTSDRPRQRHGNANCSTSPFADVIWDADIYMATWVPAKPFRRGDADANGVLAISDAIVILGYLFSAAKAPSCLAAADVTDAGALNITDPVYLLTHLFQGGPAPPEPFKSCGSDPTEDDFILGCNSFPACQ